MARISIDKEMRASTATAAAKKFARFLAENGFQWAAEEMTESVENGYFCCSNATEHNITVNGKPSSPKTADWSYYWALENVDGKDWYGWFIERT